MRDKGWKIVLFIAGAFALVVVFLAIYDNAGWQEVKHFQQEVDNIQKRIEFLRQENRTLAEEVQNLRDDPYYLEKIAREELGMVKPMEKVFIFTREGD